MQKRAIIVGSGPNGLSAAIALALAGVQVTVYESAATPGGAVRSSALTLPGFTHDLGAAVFPLTIASPFLSRLPLHEHGLQWVHPEIPLAHPLPNGDAVALLSSLTETANLLQSDEQSWANLLKPLVRNADRLLSDVLAPPVRVPRHPVLMARFAARALQPASSLARTAFKQDRTRALFAGLAAHSGVPMEYTATSASALILATTASAAGWPIARGGSQSITTALVSYIRHLGGEVVMGSPVKSLAVLPRADVVLLDIAPQNFQAMAGGSLPRYNQEKYRNVHRGPGIFKMDWALREPIPWTNELCRKAGTVHIGSSLDGIAASEKDAWDGRDNTDPYMILSQPSLFDETRAPARQHTAWAYCHVPNGSSADKSTAMEKQIQRYAPGFLDIILARASSTATQMQTWNSNLVGGDISGGAMTVGQIIARTPYLTPLPGVYLCSSATAPGGGVHGMCGYYAARAAARHMGIQVPYFPAV